MTSFKSSIITASAGTGKTYRLSLEYIRILLDYYPEPGIESDFTIDNILVLTFTRKATAEIKERIIEHLHLLTTSHPEQDKERQELISSLLEGAATELSKKQIRILTSVVQRINADRRLLQIMTLDSYIHSIFRNIVRPLRSISEFELDNNAVKKRLPALSEKLMDSYGAKINPLLSRTTKPSLDSYNNFFSSLIYNRWLFHLINQEHIHADKDSLIAHSRQAPQMAKDANEAIIQSLHAILTRVLEVATAKNEDWEGFFNKGFRELFISVPDTVDGVLVEISLILDDDKKVMRFLDAIKKGTLYNRKKINDKKEENGNLSIQSQALLLNLADYLIFTRLIPEQSDINEIWRQILRFYDKLIYQNKNLTYDDISWFCFDTLFRDQEPPYNLNNANAANEFYEFLTHRSRFILIDEFQDTSLMQFAILKPIIEEVISGYGSRDYGGLIVVGDEKQSIFGWRGGERELLLKLDGILKPIQGMEKDELKKTYRSSPTMMEFINRIFTDAALHDYLNRNGMNWKYEDVESAKPEIDPQTSIKLQCEKYQERNVQVSRDEVMQNWVVSQILPHKDSKESIAILCRKGNELEKLQSIMDEYEITSIYQPNAQLTTHRLVQPLLAFLKWRAFEDWLDWLAWLRSDYVLLIPSHLKTLLDTIKDAKGEQPDFAPHPLLEKLYQQNLAIQGNVYEICKALVEQYLDRSQINRRDDLNINAFLDLAATFVMETSTADKSIPAFLDYLVELEGQDAINQVAVEGESNIELLTIHKSKGLQFDRVFVFYDLGGRGGRDYGTLNQFTDFYERDFGSFKDMAYSLHYGGMLQHSSYKGLHTKNKHRAMLEELNSLYVAFTRAKTKLHILFAYNGTAEWEKYVEGYETRIHPLPTLICDACLRNFSELAVDGEIKGKAQEKKEESKDNTKKSEEKPPFYVMQDLMAALDFASLSTRVEPEDERYQHINHKTLWLDKSSNLIGSLCHDYLSFIIYNQNHEHEFARLQTINRYSSLMAVAEIDSYLGKLRLALNAHSDIFASRWDKVFCEMPLFDDGKERRPDRIMLDTKAHTAWIVDYKTGFTKEQDQLDTYERLLSALSFIKEHGYQINTKFIELNLKD